MTDNPDVSPLQAAEVWRLMLDMLMRTSPGRVKSLAKRHLTPNDSRVLFALDRAGKPVANLAEDIDCHPSTATWLVDRLVRLNYAERRVSKEDRRVKMVALTRKGAAATAALLAEYNRPPAAFASLTKEDLAALEALIQKLHAHLPEVGQDNAKATR